MPVWSVVAGIPKAKNRKQPYAFCVRTLTSPACGLTQESSTAAEGRLSQSDFTMSNIDRRQALDPKRWDRPKRQTKKP
jgi:hypothetical protein